MSGTVAAAVLSLTAWLVVALIGAAPAQGQSQPYNGSAARAAAAAAAGQAPAPAPAPVPRPVSAPAPTPPPAAAPATVTGEVGATGDAVKVIEERLEALHYPVGAVDSTYDADTAQAVTAFQKVHGMERTGRVTPEVWSAMASAQDPAPLVPGGAERRVEIDLPRQVLFLYEGGQLSKIVAVSTGTRVAYCENRSCGDAITPTGDFKVYRKGSGWEYGPLGGLYNPAYFVGGVALHGSKSVPTHPASHGCVRIPMSVAEWLPERLPMGTPVHVR